MRSCLWIGCCLGALVLACSDRPRRNPLDPQAEDLQSESFSALTALALDGEVELRWDFSRFSDIEGYRLYRRLPGDEWEPITPVLAPDATAYSDAGLQNGMDYEYQLSLLITGEAERPSGRPVAATPGPEVAWVADRHAGLVWKISADARSAHFAQGRFFDLAAIALDVANGSCWVSDRGFAGLYRIAEDGALAALGAAVERPGALAIDAAARIGWLADAGQQRVFWFSLDAADSLALIPVDASFARPVALAAQAGGCWIADQAQSRVLFYQTDGTRAAEFHVLAAPKALVAGTGGDAWLLGGEGHRLARLDRAGTTLYVELPFAAAVGLAVDDASGACWVLGERDLAVFSAAGILEQHWTDVPGGSALSFDPVQQRAWIATDDVLWKFTAEGQTLAQLVGFSSIVRIAVDSGR
ncbi:MAG: hypothetical protein F4Z85_07115 [Gemmatimonadetes bacterium]|nr:hypothetical protein [Gemmatimonadota bacterium]MYB71186.1 hypothetical protein [Gemmatimonadota bacterium]